MSLSTQLIAVKKMLYGILIVLTMVLLPKSVLANDNVTIYIFRGNTCSHCEEALNYINNHKDVIDDKIKIVTYEVWKNDNNAKLEKSVAEKLGVDPNSDKFGVPFIVIGNEYITGYLGVTTFNQIIKIAEGYFDDENYEDVVEKTKNELNIKVKSLTLDELFSKPSKTVTIIVYSIFGILVLGLAGMIIFARK